MILATELCLDMGLTWYVFFCCYLAAEFFLSKILSVVWFVMIIMRSTALQLSCKFSSRSSSSLLDSSSSLRVSPSSARQDRDVGDGYSDDESTFSSSYVRMDIVCYLWRALASTPRLEPVLCLLTLESWRWTTIDLFPLSSYYFFLPPVLRSLTLRLTLLEYDWRNFLAEDF